jgi:hypothetical protein
MNLWILFAVALAVFALCCCYVIVGAFDPEGRGMPHETAVIAGAGFSVLIAAGLAGALLHRHFT